MIDNFFSKYPNAPGLWQVGERLFFHSAKTQAEAAAREQATEPTYISRADWEKSKVKPRKKEKDLNEDGTE